MSDNPTVSNSYLSNNPDIKPRSVQKGGESGPVTQVMLIDIGGSGAESLVTSANPIPITLPTGAATSALQTTGNSSLSQVTACIEARTQTPAASNALNVQIGPGDVVSNIPVVSDFEHHQIHEGETHLVQDLQASLGTSTVKYSFTVPAYSPTIRAPHLVLQTDVYNGAALIQVYEGSTFAGGSPLTSRNRNRNSAVVAGASVKTGVTSSDGTLLYSFYAGGGTRTVGDGRVGSEFVMKSNTVYRIDMIGQTAGTAAIITFNWYEDLGV